LSNVARPTQFYRRKWIKNNAAWWADGTIDDESFISGIEYLLKEEIIKMD